MIFYHESKKCADFLTDLTTGYNLVFYYIRIRKKLYRDIPQTLVITSCYFGKEFGIINAKKYNQQKRKNIKPFWRNSNAELRP